MHGSSRSAPRPLPPTHKCPRQWAALELRLRQVNYANVVETSARSVGRKFYVRLSVEHKSNFDERRLLLPHCRNEGRRIERGELWLRLCIVSVSAALSEPRTSSNIITMPDCSNCLCVCVAKAVLVPAPVVPLSVLHPLSLIP